MITKCTPLHEAREKAQTSLEELKQYCDDVISGKEIACIKHKWACMRFLRDLERVGKKDFRYIFDIEKANKFLTFMPFFKHTKGPLTGERKIPESIEKFIFGNIYGWVDIKTGFRRFRKGYWQVGRKNAKSQDLAIMGSYEMTAFGVYSAECYVAATKKDQTRYVWGEARVITTNCPELNGKIKVKFHDDLSQKVIMHEKSNSFFARMTEEDKKKGDGSNPQWVALDEYHAHPTAEYYDIATSGMKTREQPFLMIITTAGFELNHPCYKDEYRYVSNILNPDSEIDNDRYYVMINELDMDEEGNLIDDINDESCWVKSNPIIAKTDVGLESIRDELQVAKDKPEKMRDFLTKTMNVWVNQRACGYMNIAKWRACKKTKEIDIQGMDLIAGFDLSSIIDLTSTGLIFEFEDFIYVKSKSFIPEETLFTKMKSDKVPYDRWIKQGHIIMTPGASVDYKFMIEWLLEFVKNNGLNIKELCFDRYLANRLMPELAEDGYTVVEIPQGIPTLGEPTKDFRAKVYDKKIIHDDDPVLNWAIGNAVTTGGKKYGINKVGDKNENFMLDKSKSIDRIDPIAAILNGYTRVWLQEKPKVSIYEERGVRSI
jgi:phage terminase large subunit-like protein